MPENISLEKYKELKKKLVEIEKTNYDKIILIPCRGDKGWYEMGEHSALIYYYRVCTSVKAKVKFEGDADSYYTPYEIGRIRTRGHELVEKRVKQAGYHKVTRTKNSCYIIILKEKFTKDDIDGMLAMEMHRRQKNGEIISVVHSAPVFHYNLVELSKKLHNACGKKLDKLSSQTNGVRMVSVVDKMIIEYYECSGKKINKETWRKFYNDIQHVLYEVQVASAVKLWNDEVCLTIGKLLVELKEEASKYIDGPNKSR